MKLSLPGLEKLPKLLDRFKYPLAVLILGVALLLWPGRSSSKPVEAEPLPAATEPEADGGERSRNKKR